MDPTNQLLFEVPSTFSKSIGTDWSPGSMSSSGTLKFILIMTVKSRIADYATVIYFMQSKQIQVLLGANCFMHQTGVYPRKDTGISMYYPPTFGTWTLSLYSA